MGMNVQLLSVAIRREQDILLARQRARQISQFLGFSEGDTTRITTAPRVTATGLPGYAFLLPRLP